MCLVINDSRSYVFWPRYSAEGSSARDSGGCIRHTERQEGEGRWGDPSISRQLAESQFSLEAVLKSLIEILQAAAMDRRVDTE